MRKIVLLYTSLLLLIGCDNLYNNDTTVAAPDIGDKEPDMEGEIYHINDGYITIVEDPQEVHKRSITAVGQQEIQKNVPVLDSNASIMSFGFLDETKIYFENGTEGSFEDFRLGQNLYVWHSRLVRDSFPPRADALLIVITE